MGATNIGILFILITLFTGIGVMLPFIQEDLGQNTDDFNAEGVLTDVQNEAGQTEGVGALNVILSVVKMFFWTFGDIPFWFDLVVFVPLRIIGWSIALVSFVPFIGGGA